MLKGYLTLEVTHSKIRYIFLNRDHQGYKILKSGIISQNLNINASGELSRTLENLIQREEIHPQRMFVSVCLQENPVRQVDIPKMSLNKIEEGLIEEIKKSPSFNNRKFDTIFDVSYKKGANGNLVFAAIEQSVLDYILTECGSLRIPFGHLEIVPLNLKEVLPLIEPDVENHTVLFINDQVSYLMTASGGQWKFISRSTIGIEHLYPLMNDKLDHTYFINLAGDLQRVIKTYMSQQKIEKLDKLWIIWDQQGAYGLAAALAGKLNINIQVLNLERLSNFNLGLEAKSANPMDLICVYPVVIFLERIKEQFKLNHFFRAQQYKNYVFKLMISAIFILGLTGYGLGLKSREYYLQQKKFSVESDVFSSSIEHFKNAKDSVYLTRDQYVAVRQELLNHVKYINSLNRTAWSRAISIFIKVMPSKMALTSFRFDQSGQISFSGEALDVKSVTELVNSLEKSSVFEQGLIDSFTEKLIGSQRVFVFRIIARLQVENQQENR